VENNLIFDTNILVHLVRSDRVGERIRAKYSPLIAEPRPSICAVTEGELRSLAYQWGWGKQKRDQMDFLLGYFWQLPIELPEMVEAYALIDSFSEKNGFTMGKNDVWIAAAAHLTGATIITTDKDFTHLQPDFLHFDWIDPDLENKIS
jgi:predicted nucleic acid-binding protein